MLPNDFEELSARVGLAEGRIRALEPEDVEEVPTPAAKMTSLPQSASTQAGSFYKIAPQLISLTVDAAWHSFTIPSGIPSNAVGILFSIRQKMTSTIVANQFKVRSNILGDEYELAYADCDLGSNRLEWADQVIGPVGSTFEYRIDNDPDWALTISVVGYFA